MIFKNKYNIFDCSSLTNMAQNYIDLLKGYSHFYVNAKLSIIRGTNL